MEIYCSSSRINNPILPNGKKNQDPPPNAEKIAPDITRGQSSHIDRNDCDNDSYIWVHAKDGWITGDWS